eukprot:CFRG6655T1
MNTSIYESLTAGELTKALHAKDAALEVLQCELEKEKDRALQLEITLEKLKLERPADDYLKQVLTEDDDDEKGTPILTVDELVDMFVTFYDEAKVMLRSKRRGNGSKTVSGFLTKYDAAYRCAKQKRMNKASFEYVTTIGHGSFSTIQLVKQKETSTPFVIKRLTKADATSQQSSLFWTTELELLIEASRCDLYDGHRAPGIAALRYAFHDATYLYFVLDYYPGGDLLSLLGKHEHFKEEMALFYMAEMVIAVSTIHRMGYLHRDIKIENFLLDAKGHVYLTDFGSAVKCDERGQSMSYMTGGTAEYISPELVKIMQGDTSISYGPGVDWWSLGVILFEMLTGETPFYDDSVLHVYHNIENYKTSLRFDSYEDVTVSPEAQDLVRSLIKDQDSRLGRGGVAEIMNHEWFTGVEWNQVLRQTKVPFKPNLVGKFDTTFFDDCEIEDVETEPIFKRKSTILSRNPSHYQEETSFGELLPYVGFAYCYKGLTEERQEGNPFIEEQVRSHKKRKSSQENNRPLSGTFQARNGNAYGGGMLVASVDENSTNLVSTKVQPSKDLSTVSEHGQPHADAPTPSYPQHEGVDEGYLDGGASSDMFGSVNKGVEIAPVPRRGSLMDLSNKVDTGRRIRFTNQIVLFHAANTGDLGSVKELVKQEGLESTNELEMTALHYAVYGSQLDVVKFLVEAGATIDARMHDSNTPLYVALWEEEDEIAMYLIAKGADLHYTNKDGRTAIDLTGDPVMKAAINAQVAKQDTDGASSNLSRGATVRRRT